MSTNGSRRHVTINTPLSQIVAETAKPDTSKVVVEDTKPVPQTVVEAVKTPIAPAKPAIVVPLTYKISCPTCNTVILDVSSTKICKTYTCPLCGKKFLFVSEEKE